MPYINTYILKISFNWFDKVPHPNVVSSERRFHWHWRLTFISNVVLLLVLFCQSGFQIELSLDVLRSIDFGEYKTLCLIFFFSMLLNTISFLFINKRMRAETTNFHWSKGISLLLLKKYLCLLKLWVHIYRLDIESLLIIDL